MKVIKKPVVVGFEIAKQTTVVQTLEGPVTAQPGDAIMTGVKGERYPIRGPKFAETYDIVGEGKCAKKAVVVEAKRMDEPFTVTVGWSSEPLQGKPGDYHLTYGPGDFGVVAADIFAATYDIVEA